MKNIRPGVLIGKKESLVVAEYVYWFLLNTSKDLWQDFRKKHPGQRAGKVAFDIGFMRGIQFNHEMMFKDHNVKINGDASLPVAAIKALRIRCQAENSYETKRLFPQTRKGGKTSFRMDRTAFTQGLVDGKNTHINRPVEHKKTGTSALLGM